MSGISGKEKGLLHIYPDYAGIGEVQRREILRKWTGCVSSADPALSQAGFEKAMAAYEVILWDRVSRGQASDPRMCRQCGSEMRHGSPDFCPRGCERRKVAAWDPNYWRRKVPATGTANTRVLWRIRSLWAILTPRLPEAQRSESYLAGIIAKGSADVVVDLCVDGVLRWDRVSAVMAHRAIEALKDRLAYAIRSDAKPA